MNKIYRILINNEIIIKSEEEYYVKRYWDELKENHN